MDDSISNEKEITSPESGEDFYSDAFDQFKEIFSKPYSYSKFCFIFNSFSFSFCMKLCYTILNVPLNID